MNNIQILDCTLRDGGYCNEWRFGFKNTKKIVKGLLEAGIEIIECGFLTNRVDYNCDITKFNTLQQVATVIPEKRDNCIFVVMVNYGEFNIEQLQQNNGSSIDGIRVAFHKKDRYEALKLFKNIQEKGYLVFIHAMVSLGYTDEEFLEMIHIVNEFKPYAFYIVDSFGMMKEKDLTRLFYMVEHNLEKKICIGFHSHNNLQLAYSNAQKLISVQTNRNLIIDCSVYGMGRGAGNLNTELLIDYFNENVGKKYLIKPLLGLIDEIINGFYQTNYWGYSLPNYISAVHNAHPNYAGYLDDKKTLTIENMNEIFEMMDKDKKVSYDKDYIENLYLVYMESGKVQEEHKIELYHTLAGKKILLIGPGKSSVEEISKIQEFSRQENVVPISVNFVYEYVEPQFIFFSNIRRFKDLPEHYRKKCIVTSNIPAEGIYYQTKYKDLLNSEEAVKDNAGLMAIKFLSEQSVDSIYLAGFDGYSHDVGENYGSSDMAFITRNIILDAMNSGMCEVLKKYKDEEVIVFLTAPKHITI